jgi:hypothetical protein
MGFKTLLYYIELRARSKKDEGEESYGAFDGEEELWLWRVAIVLYEVMAIVAMAKQAQNVGTDMKTKGLKNTEKARRRRRRRRRRRL